MQAKRTFSPLYLAILSGVILIILFINGLLEINRTKRGLYLLLEREGLALLRQIDREMQQAMGALQRWDDPREEGPLSPSVSEFLFSLEESVAEYLIETARTLDSMDAETPSDGPVLQRLTGEYLLSSIGIYDEQGRLLRGWPTAPRPSSPPMVLREWIERKRSVLIDLFGRPSDRKTPFFSVAVSRRSVPGILLLRLNDEAMKGLLRRFAVQRVLAEIGLQEGVLFVEVYDDRLHALTPTDPVFVRKADDPFLKASFKESQPISRVDRLPSGEEILEVLRAFSLEDQSRGVIRIACSSREIQPVLRQLRKSVFLSIFFFLLFGIAAITLIWVNQNRHLRKMRELEDRVRLAERLSSLGHLAAGVAHEVRNPLNAIGMGLQRLKKEFVPQEGSKKKEYHSFIELILKEIQRVNAIVQEFLTLSRPFKLEIKESSLESLLTHVSALFREELDSKGITLETNFSPRLPVLPLDAGRLTQALINIMKNGIEAMPSGGTLRLECYLRKNHVFVSISDSGSGISPEQMEKVFNYYYTTKEKGVGLGLPLAHRIIEAHGGQLKIESRIGSGTTVTITLPTEKRAVDGGVHESTPP